MGGSGCVQTSAAADLKYQCQRQPRGELKNKRYYLNINLYGKYSGSDNFICFRFFVTFGVQEGEDNYAEIQLFENHVQKLVKESVAELLELNQQVVQNI